MWDSRFTTQWDYLVTESGVPASWVYPTHAGTSRASFGHEGLPVDEPWRTHVMSLGNDLAPLHPSIPFVILSPQNGHNIQGEISLKNFVHPAECFYVFGSDRHNMALDDDGINLDPDIDGFPPGRLIKVYIPGVGDSLHSVNAASMVMYDRIQKALPGGGPGGGPGGP